MSMVEYLRRVLLVGILLGLYTGQAVAIDGVDLPAKYDGFLAASQANGTGFGNHQDIQEEGILVGSELDALHVTADAESLWIGITGNLPNKLAGSQSIVILLDTGYWTANNPNVLGTSDLVGFGGGYSVIKYLDGTILEQGWRPDTAIVVNRFAESTYVDSWFIPTNAQDPWYEGLIGLDPYDDTFCDGPFGCYMSAWMDTTNLVGVDDDETKDGAVQEGMAAGAVKGLRLRLDRLYFGISATVKIMVLLASPGDVEGEPVTHVSNQVLPPLSTDDDPPAPDCLGFRQNFDESYEDPPASGFFGLLGVQFAEVDLTVNTGTPAEIGGFDGSDIPGAWPGGSLVATQQIHTCYGNAVEGTLNYTVEGSELDELFVRADDEYLQVAVSGNLEGNCNKIALFIDADPLTGENTMDYNSPQDPPEDQTFIIGWQGRTFDDGFAPEHVYYVSHCGGTLYVDHFRLLLPDAEVKEYQGFSVVESGSGVLDSEYGSNPYGNEFALDHSNNAGVVSMTDPASPGDPATATTGLEARISLEEIGVTFGSCAEVRVMAVLTGGDGTYLSNHFLPSLMAGTDYNIASEALPEDPRFDFGETNPVLGGDPALEGDQFAEFELRRLGDVFVEPECCINFDDLDRFVQVLLGNETAPDAIFWSDMNQDGDADGEDIDEFVARLLAEGVCP